MPTWSQPLCLIESGAGDQLNVNERTVAQLAQIPGPVVVVGIAGLYRTGKSYLMNLLAGHTKGFDLGSTIQAKTKGIWIWVVDHPTQKGYSLILLDTEGLGDTDRGDRNHDTWIFALSVLLSSTLVYNSKGTIDNDALEKLHFVTEIADHIKVKSDGEDDDSDFDRFFPGFVWAVRDFSLDLELDGRKISSHEYLESALQLKRGVGRKVQDYNLPRECIRRYFPTRACFTFPAPVNSSSMMGQLETLMEGQLDPVFVQVAHDFRNYIYTKSRPKVIQGISINGSMLGGLAKAYVEAIQKGAVPCIESAVKVTSKLENERGITNCLSFYTNCVNERVKLPTQTTDELSAIHQKCEKDTIAAFLKVAIFDDEHTYQKLLAMKIQEEYTKFCQANEQASYQMCMSILHQLCQALDQKISTGAYMTPGGYKAYISDLKGAEHQYNATPGKGIKSAEALREFLDSRQSEGSSILAADEKITEEEKKQEEERKRAELAEQERQAAEEARQATQQRMEDQQRSHDENVRQLKDKMTEELQAQREEQEHLVTTRMEEQRKLLQEGFDTKAQNMQEEITKLQKEQEEAEKRAREQTSFIETILRPVIEVAFDVLGGRVLKAVAAAGSSAPKTKK